MKSYLATLLLIFAMTCAYPCRGQGIFALSNYEPPYGVDAPVFNADCVPLEGTNFLARLYAGPTVDSLQPTVPTASFFSGTFAGYFIGDVGSYFVSVPGVAPGNFAWLQIRVWDARLGASYEEVAALGLGGYGQSTLFQGQAGGDVLPGFLIGLQSFNLLPIVPEPSTALLLWLGLPWLLWRGRARK